MTVKELLLQELEGTTDPLLAEVLDYLRYLKFRQEEDAADLRDARTALVDAQKEGTVSWAAVEAEAGL